RGSRIARVFAPGRYYMFIDARAGTAGPYQLALSFLPVRPASNDTCAAPADIPAAGTQVVSATLSAVTARDDYQGTCGGSGVDHVYSFTVTERTGLTAKV